MNDNNEKSNEETTEYTDKQKEIIRANFGGIPTKKKVTVNNVVQEKEQDTKTEK